jgi:hypothetical protein
MYPIGLAMHLSWSFVSYSWQKFGDHTSSHGALVGLDILGL